MKKVYLLLFLLALLPFVVNAAPVEINGIYYNLVSKVKTAEVTSNPNKYSGKVTIPKTVTYGGKVYSVTSISDDAFSRCSGLKSITIPNSVTSIGGYAFYGCIGLTSVTIPNSVTSIGGYAFQGCSGLTSVTIPASVTSIGCGAFSICSGLTSVIIPASVTSIGDHAFWGCSGLTSITIPNSVISINEGAFRECNGLTSVTIPNSVTCIGDHAFGNCYNLTSVTIPNSVTSIGNYAFHGCRGLTSVTIPNSVTNIGEEAFSGCSGLTSITIGNGIEWIDYHAFAECPELTDVYCMAENAPETFSDAFEGSYIEYATLHVPVGSVDAYKATEPWSGFKDILAIGTKAPDQEFTDEQGVKYTLNDIGNSYTVSSHTDDCSGAITIPKTVNGYNVTSIGERAFSNCTALTSVTIPASVTSIGEAAFEGCDLAEVISLIENPFDIDNFVFSDNTYSNATLTIPAGTKAAYQAKGGWKSFKNILAIDETISTSTAITIGSYGVGTFSSQYDVDFSSVEGLKAYIAAGYDDDSKTIWLLRVFNVPAGTGLLVMGTPGETYDVPHTVTHSYYTNMLQGNTGNEITIGETDGEMTNYYLKEGKFLQVSTSAKIGQGKSYLQLPTHIFAHTRSVGYVVTDDDKTAISTPAITDQAPDVYYNLQGQRVEHPSKGLYIKNGKKVIVR